MTKMPHRERMKQQDAVGRWSDESKGERESCRRACPRPINKFEIPQIIRQTQPIPRFNLLSPTMVVLFVIGQCCGWGWKCGTDSFQCQYKTTFWKLESKTFCNFRALLTKRGSSGSLLLWESCGIMWEYPLVQLPLRQRVSKEHSSITILLKQVE